MSKLEMLQNQVEYFRWKTNDHGSSDEEIYERMIRTGWLSIEEQEVLEAGEEENS